MPVVDLAARAACCLAVGLRQVTKAVERPSFRKSAELKRHLYQEHLFRVADSLDRRRIPPGEADGCGGTLHHHSTERAKQSGDPSIRLTRFSVAGLFGFEPQLLSYRLPVRRREIFEIVKDHKRFTATFEVSEPDSERAAKMPKNQLACWCGGAIVTTPRAFIIASLGLIRRSVCFLKDWRSSSRFLEHYWFWMAWNRSKIRPGHKKDAYVSLPSRRFCVSLLL